MPRGSQRESSGNAERTGADRGRQRTPRRNPPRGSGRGARPLGGGRSLPSRLRPASRTKSLRPPSGRAHQSRSTRSPEMHGLRRPRAPRAWKTRPGSGGHHSGSTPMGAAVGRKTVPGPAARLPASHGPYGAGGVRVKRRLPPPFSWGESAFSPSPYGHFL